MKILFAALALALPAAAHAEAAPEPKAEKRCCCEMMDRKMACCDEHGERKDKEAQPRPDAHEGHSGH